jgi:hypothetical protein
MPAAQTPAGAHAAPGRPTPTPVGQTTAKPAVDRVNMMMSQASLDVLDATSERILRNTGSRINRSQLVRAMVEAFGESRLAFIACRTEADVKAALLRTYCYAIRMAAREKTEAQRPR